MKKSILAFLVIALLGGCIPSIYPLITPEMAINMDEIIGLYQDEEGEYIAFSKSPHEVKNTYILSSGGSPETLEDLHEVRFAWLNNRLFANFYPVNPETGKCSPPDFVAMNTFARVQLTRETLKLEYSDMDELKRMFREGKVRLQHEEYGKNGGILITASSRQLQKFIKQHGGNDVFFGVEKILSPAIKTARPGK